MLLVLFQFRHWIDRVAPPTLAAGHLALGAPMLGGGLRHALLEVRDEFENEAHASFLPFSQEAQRSHDRGPQTPRPPDPMCPPKDPRKESPKADAEQNEHHRPSWKRGLALDQVEVMAALGHDRGARVTPPGGLAAISSASRLCPN
jgi:hypothetical protein